MQPLDHPAVEFNRMMFSQKTETVFMNISSQLSTGF